MKFGPKEKNSGKNRNIGGKLGLDYKISEKLTTGFTVDLYAGNRKGTGGTKTMINSLDKNELLSYILNDRNGSKGNTKYNTLNYHVIYKMDTIGKKLTFDFDWVNFNNNNTSVTSNRFLTQIMLRIQQNIKEIKVCPIKKQTIIV